MTDLQRILPLWSELEAAAADYVLATVVQVQGSSYRKPGACMLLAPDGRRAGTVSGGCLEAEVARRAWWLTADGPIIQSYSTAEEDGELPYGSGCGGVVFLLIERRQTAGPLYQALARAFEVRSPLAVATILEGSECGRRAFAGLPRNHSQSLRPAIETHQATIEAHLQDLANQALKGGGPIEQAISTNASEVRLWANLYPARPGLWIFGAGDDAQPLLSLARELGWFVTVADGRSHLATRGRFPLADDLRVLKPNLSEAPPANSSANPQSSFDNLHPADFRSNDTVVLMTHSFEQDARILAFLLAGEIPLPYIGVLGPQRRTRELLAEASRLLNLPAISASAADARVEHWLVQLHAPMGLDLGAESPQTIALSVVAEIQKTLTAATALPLRQVRATFLTTSN